MIFPLISIILAYLSWSVLWYKNKEESNIAEPRKNDLMNLIPYLFLLIAFFWFFHIVLDLDSGEGAMLLLWPLDDQLYQVQLLAVFDAFPFLFLPWKPLGFELDIQHSNIQGLLIYLLNWTPQQIQDFFGSTMFKLSFVGLILHISILIVYLNIVVKPLIPSFSFKSSNKFWIKLNTIKQKSIRFWKSIPKFSLITGIFLLLIGFSIGPMLGQKISSTVEVNGTIKFQPLQFQPLVQLNFETVSQPLDFVSIQGLNYKFAFPTALSNNLTLYLIVANSFWFTNFGNQINLLLDEYFNPPFPDNDSLFHEEYINLRNDIIKENPTILLEQVTEDNLGSLSLKEKNSYGIGFLLYDWISSPKWNDTSLATSINLSAEIFYERTINFWFGLATEITGFLLILFAVLIRKNSNELAEKSK